MREVENSSLAKKPSITSAGDDRDDKTQMKEEVGKSLLEDDNIHIEEKVGEFWSERSKWKPNDSYRIREFTNECPKPFFRRNKGLGREIFFFACLIGVGSIIVGLHWSLIEKNEFFASMFFASGFIPIIQLVLFEILPGQFKMGRKEHIRRPVELDDILSGILAIAFLAVAISLHPSPEARESGWTIVSGKTLFEAGLIYFVTRVLFFVPNPNDEVRALQEEVKLLKQSMAIGLADGYFYNLVREIAIDVKDAPDGSMKLTYGSDEVVSKMVSRFIVIVPRELDWLKEDPITDFIKAQRLDGGMNDYYFKNCKIEKSPNRPDGSRPKWVNEVNFNNTADDDDEKNEGILVDIPTTLTALLMDLRLNSQNNDEIDDDSKKKFENEINSFSCRIAWQLKRHNLEKYVTVAEVKDLNIGLSKIRDLVKKAPSDSV